MSQHFKHDMPLHLLIHLFVGFPTCVAFKNKNYMPILLEKQIRHCSIGNFLCFLDGRGGSEIWVFFGWKLELIYIEIFIAFLNNFKISVSKKIGLKFPNNKNCSIISWPTHKLIHLFKNLLKTSFWIILCIFFPHSADYWINFPNFTCPWYSIVFSVNDARAEVLLSSQYATGIYLAM